jgi:hypothetical protein
MAVVVIAGSCNAMGGGGWVDMHVLAPGWREGGQVSFWWVRRGIQAGRQHSTLRTARLRTPRHPAQGRPADHGSRQRGGRGLAEELEQDAGALPQGQAARQVASSCPAASCPAPCPTPRPFLRPPCSPHPAPPTAFLRLPRSHAARPASPNPPSPHPTRLWAPPFCPCRVDVSQGRAGACGDRAERHPPRQPGPAADGDQALSGGLLSWQRSAFHSAPRRGGLSLPPSSGPRTSSCPAAAVASAPAAA